jgi:hypothetical protein
MLLLHSPCNMVMLLVSSFETVDLSVCSNQAQLKLHVQHSAILSSKVLHPLLFVIHSSLHLLPLL